MKHILVSAVLTLTTMAASAQPMAELPQVNTHSGVFELLSPLSLQHDSSNFFRAKLFTDTGEKTAVTCELTGTVWSFPVGKSNQREVMAVPGTMHISCPGKDLVAVLGSFMRMSTQKGWSPSQSTRCIREERRYDEQPKCVMHGSEVPAGARGRWVTWHVIPFSFDSNKK